MKEEIWKDIEGFEGLYQISNYGSARSFDRIYKGNLSNHTGKLFYAEKSYKGKTLKTESTGRKYHVICLVKEGRRIYKSIHRLVGKYFVPNPENKTFINHKDGNKLNNFYLNLEWTDRKGNGAHAVIMGLYRTGEQHKNSRIILNTENGIFYFGAREAAESLGYNKQYLNCMLNGVNYNKTPFIHV